MATFTYIALNEQGAEKQGEIEALNAQEVARSLRAQSLLLISIKEGGQFDDPYEFTGWKKYLSYLSIGQYRPVNSGDLLFLFRQLALMLKSGHTIVQALRANEEMTRKRSLNRALGEMIKEIEAGGSFSKSIQDRPRVFPKIVGKLLEAGEQSGEIDTILVRLADDIEKSQDLTRQLVTALTYPSIVFLMAIGVSVAMILFVIPRFAKFLAGKGTELPPMTQFLMDISAWFEIWGSTVGIVTIILVTGVLAASTTLKGKKIIDLVLLNIPVIGKVITSSAMAQATWTLAMQLRSGITLINSLQIISDVMGNKVIAAAFSDAKTKILSGQPLSVALRAREIPQLVNHMAAIGEKSGELEGTLQALGEFYHKDLQARVKILSALVYPMMILFVGGIVGVVYIAFFQAALSVSAGGR